MCDSKITYIVTIVRNKYSNHPVICLVIFDLGLILAVKVVLRWHQVFYTYIIITKILIKNNQKGHIVIKLVKSSVLGRIIFSIHNQLYLVNHNLDETSIP